MSDQAFWYVACVHSGSENKVAESIREQADKKGFSSLIKEVLVPTEDVHEMRRGVKSSTEKKFFPGYVLIQMVLNDDTWHLIRSIPKVSGFLGTKEKPSPMRQSEVDLIVRQVQDRIESPRTTINFEVGEKVRVSDGPFATFTGLVEEIDLEKTRLKVSVSIFGRATPVELEFTQVEKV